MKHIPAREPEVAEHDESDPDAEQHETKEQPWRTAKLKGYGKHRETVAGRRQPPRLPESHSPGQIPIGRFERSRECFTRHTAQHLGPSSAALEPYQ